MLFGHHAASETPTSGCSYVARIEFEYGPRRYQIGEDFDWRALGLNETQAYELWVAGRLLVKPATKPVSQVQPPPRAARR